VSLVSILFVDEALPLRNEEPAFFGDLNLTQVVRTIMAGRETYDLVPYFCTCVSDEDAVAYRHEVFRDLQNDDVSSLVRAFAEAMREMHKLLALQADRGQRRCTARRFRGTTGKR